MYNGTASAQTSAKVRKMEQHSVRTKAGEVINDRGTCAGGEDHDMGSDRYTNVRGDVKKVLACLLGSVDPDGHVCKTCTQTGPPETYVHASVP